MDPISPSFGSYIKDRVPYTFGVPEKDFISGDNPKIEGVNEDVPVVRWVEINLPSNRGTSKRVAVSTNPSHNTMSKMFRFGMIDISKPKGVERGNWSRSHRKNISKNPTHSCCSSLVWFDKRGMVVALYFKCNGIVIVDRNNPGILSRALNDARSSGGEFLQ